MNWRKLWLFIRIVWRQNPTGNGERMSFIFSWEVAGIMHDHGMSLWAQPNPSTAAGNSLTLDAAHHVTGIGTTVMMSLSKMFMTITCMSIVVLRARQLQRNEQLSTPREGSCVAVKPNYRELDECPVCTECGEEIENNGLLYRPEDDDETIICEFCMAEKYPERQKMQ